MRHFILLLNLLLLLPSMNAYTATAIELATAKSASYLPLVEDGKCWKYRWKDTGFAATDDDDRDGYMIFEGTKNINGNEYAVLNSYRDFGNGIEFETPMGYFREDVGKKKVWYINAYSTDSKERVLYDFNGISQNQTALADIVPEFDDNIIFTDLQGVERSSLVLRNPAECMITEGLGLIPTEPECEASADKTLSFTLLGLSDYPTCYAPKCEGIPYLYEIARKDGSVLFSHEANRRRAGIESIPADAGIRISRNGNEVNIASGKCNIGDISVITASGMTVRSFHVNDRTFTINTTGYAPGAYIVKAGTETMKIVLR